MPTSVWSDMARKQVEPPLNSEKQMTAGARLLMRLRANSRQGRSYKGHLPLRLSCSAILSSGSDHLRLRPYDGLSRMKGNFHVRFLEGGGLATARLHSATSCPSALMHNHQIEQPLQNEFPKLPLRKEPLPEPVFRISGFQFSLLVRLCPPLCP